MSLSYYENSFDPFDLTAPYFPHTMFQRITSIKTTHAYPSVDKTDLYPIFVYILPFILSSEICVYDSHLYGCMYQ